MNSFWIFISPNGLDFQMGERFFLSTMIKKLGVGNKVNIEFYGKLIGTLIPRPALFLTCHMIVKLNLDQKLAIYVHYIAGSRVHAVDHTSTPFSFCMVDEK